MKRHLTVLGAVLLVASGCGRTEPTLLLIEELPDVTSISIEGNERFSDGTLEGLMSTTARGLWPFGDHKFREAQFESDLKAILTYYRRNGYLRARIVDRTVEERDGEVRITIVIEEGTPVTVREVVIQGARAMNPNLLREKLAMKRGEPLDPFALQDDRLLILRTLGGLGYWNADVRSNVQFFEDEALVFYVLEEGDPVTVREITVRGNRNIREEQVLRDISVEKGQPLRYDDLVKSQTRLLQSGYFSDAQWDTTALDTLAGTIDVRFRVRERKMQWVEAGVGYNSQEQVTFTGEWGWRSFLDSGWRFAVNNRTDFDRSNRVKTLVRNSQTDLVFNRTHVLGTRWELQVVPSYFYIREGTQEGFEYQQDILRGALTVRRRFGDLRNQIVAGLENRWVWNDADSGAAAADPQLARDHYQTRLLSGLVERDARNDFFSPTDGAYQRVLVQWAGGALGGNNGFVKVSLSNSLFGDAPVGPGTLAARIQVGYAVPTLSDPGPDEIAVERIPTEDRYFLGGGTTVRGYDQNRLDGRVLFEPGLPEGGLAEFLFNLEFRVPLFWRFGVVGFLDSGNVWQDERFISLDRWVPHADPNNVDRQDVRYTYGLGLRLATPVGPVRVDYARKWNRPLDSPEGRDRWHFALGHAF